MKLKTMAVLAVSGLMAASLAYVLPAFAEDANDIDGSAPMQLAMADDSNSAADSSATPADSSANPVDKSGDASGANGSSSSSNDQGTPDVASGDDDY